MLSRPMSFHCPDRVRAQIARAARKAGLTVSRATALLLEDAVRRAPSLQALDSEARRVSRLTQGEP